MDTEAKKLRGEDWCVKVPDSASAKTFFQTRHFRTLRNFCRAPLEAPKEQRELRTRETEELRNSDARIQDHKGARNLESLWRSLRHFSIGDELWTMMPVVVRVV